MFMKILVEYQEGDGTIEMVWDFVLVGGSLFRPGTARRRSEYLEHYQLR